MSSDFLDIALTKRVVKTQKYGDLNVYGLSVEGLAELWQSNPELMKLFNSNEEKIIVSAATIKDLGVSVFASFIAAGLGYSGDEEAIARCKKMNPVDAVLIAEAVLEETFPGGAANFFKGVAGKIGEAGLSEMVKEIASQQNQVKA